MRHLGWVLFLAFGLSFWVGVNLSVPLDAGLAVLSVPRVGGVCVRTTRLSTPLLLFLVAWVGFVHASVQTLSLPRNHLSAFPVRSEVVTVEGYVVTPLDLIGENSLFGIEATVVIRSYPVFTVCGEMQVTCAFFTPMVRPGDRVRIQCSHTQTTAGVQYRWVRILHLLTIKGALPHCQCAIRL